MMMNTIFAPLIAKNLILVYIDDILIHAPTKKQLHKTTKEVLKILQEHNLYLKPKKYQFAKQRLSYLGYIISPDQVQMDPIKLKAISDWPAPSIIKETRKFLGFCNFYRKFIRDYAKIALPINHLVKKNMKFTWTEEAQKAFDKLKKKFKEKPIFITSDPTKAFEIFANALNHTTGAVLIQRDDNGVQHPCFFYSKPLSPVEKCYHTSEQEFLVIIQAIQEWKHYIDGVPDKTIIWTDHNNIIYWTNPAKLLQRMIRWLTTLSAYKIKIKYIAGNKNTIADTLSQKFIEDKDKYEPKQAISDEFIDKSTFPAEELSNEPTLEEKQSILRQHHNSLTAGHPGIKETLCKVSKQHSWPGLKQFVINYVKGCENCQRYKINRHPLKPPLQGISAPPSNRPFAQITMDLITNLPKSKGFDCKGTTLGLGLVT